MFPGFCDNVLWTPLRQQRIWAASEPEMLVREYLAYYNSIQKRKKKTA